MTEEEYQYHLHRAIQLGDLGLCSRMRNGLIKVEGEAPMNEEQLLNWIPKNNPWWHSRLEKLRSLV